MFPFREMAKTMNTCRIYKVYDVIGQVVPEDSAFWDIRVPLLLRLGCDWTLEDRRARARDPQISMFSSSGFPQLRRERDPSPTIRHPGKKQRTVRPTMHLGCIS